MIIYLKRGKKDNGLKKLALFEKDCWIKVTDPKAEEINFLAENFSLDRDLLIEGLDEEEIPRIEFRDNKTYIFVKTIWREKNSLKTLLIILAEEFFLTLAREEPESIKEISEGKGEFITSQKIKCIITLLYRINDKFEQATAGIIKEVQKRKTATKKLKEKDIGNLLHYEDVLNNLVSSYYYISLLYTKMIKRINFSREDKEFIEDLSVESTQGLSLCRTSLKTISNIRHYYSIILSKRLDKTIKVLTIFTILVSIPAAISGIFGMNVALPLQENPLAFLYVVMLIIIIMGSFVYYLKVREIL